MKISLKILISISLSLMVALVFLLILWTFSRETQREAARGQLYNEIKSRIDSLNILISASPAIPSKSRARQINTVQKSITSRLDDLTPRDSREATLIAQIKANSLDLGYSLAKLTAAWDTTTRQDRYNVLISQLTMKAQFIADDTNILAGISQARIDATQRTMTYLTFGLIVALVVINAAISFFFGKSVLDSQQKLRYALEKAEEGDRLLRAMLDSVPEGITICDRDCRIRMISRHGQQSLSEGDAVSGPLELVLNRWRHFQPDGQTLVPTAELPLIRAVRTGEVLEDIELLQISDSGERLSLLCNAAAIRSSDGAIIGGIVVWRDITERKQVINALTASEKKYRELIETANSIIIRWGRDGTIRFINDFGLAFFGYTAEQLLGRDVLLLAPEEEKSADKNLQTLAKDIVVHPEHYAIVQAENITRDGRTVWVNWSNKAIFDDAGEVDEILAIGNDITGLKKAKEALQVNLAEKEVLLKEIHHRVKNNMQVISSLVSMQAYEVADPAMRAVFEDVTYRVRSMAMVHEKLYQSMDLARIDFADYIKSLFGFLWRAHESAAARVNIEYQLQPVSLSVNAAVPCGLILNELFSNALKHAFIGREKGKIVVALHQDGENNIHISVQDDGIGLPGEIDWQHSQSLGLRIVRTLVRQLRAEFKVHSTSGTRFALCFAGDGEQAD